MDQKYGSTDEEIAPDAEQMEVVIEEDTQVKTVEPGFWNDVARHFDEDDLD